MEKKYHRKCVYTNEFYMIMNYIIMSLIINKTYDFDTAQFSMRFRFSMIEDKFLISP